MEDKIMELDKLQAELRGADLSDPKNIEKSQKINNLIKEIYGI